MRVCGNCEMNGSVVCPTIPPKYRCDVTGEYHNWHHECDIEFAPVRHGHWIPIDPDSRGWSTVFKCSVCHCITAYPYVTNGMDYDYCPNCGAIMDEKGWKDEA